MFTSIKVFGDYQVEMDVKYSKPFSPYFVCLASMSLVVSSGARCQAVVSKLIYPHSGCVQTEKALVTSSGVMSICGLSLYLSTHLVFTYSKFLRLR